MLTRKPVLQRLGCSVPDWSQVRRKGMGVRRDLRDALSNMVGLLVTNLVPRAHTTSYTSHTWVGG